MSVLDRELGSHIKSRAGESADAVPSSTPSARARTGRISLIGASVLIALFAAGCGGSGDSSDSGSGGNDDQMSMTAGGGMNKGGTMDMVSLVDKTVNDVVLNMSAMGPERFFVSVGAKQREQIPTRDDDVHMMVSLSDAKSGIRLPDAAVTLRVTDPNGKVTYDGPLYPMIARSMGMHYGENMPLGVPGKYTADLVVTPPRIGRHADSEGAWSKTIRMKSTFNWDGTTVSPSA